MTEVAGCEKKLVGSEERVEKFGWTLKVVLDCKAPLKQLQQLATKVAGCE